MPRSLNPDRSGSRGTLRFALPSSRDRNFAAERGQCKGNGHFTIEIVVFALEDGVLLDVNDDIKIAGRPAANSRLPVAG